MPGVQPSCAASTRMRDRDRAADEATRAEVATLAALQQLAMGGRLRAGALAALALALLAGEARAAVDVTITLEDVAGSALRRGVATGVLEVPAERLFRAMADVDHWAEFMPFMVGSAPVPEAPGEVWEQRLDLPFPLLDRHYRVHVAARRAADGGWTVEWRHVAGSGNVEGVDGQLTARPAGPNRTAVELRLWTDLGGLASVAAQEEMLHRSLPWILDGLRQQAGRCRYDVPVAETCEEEPASTPAPSPDPQASETKERGMATATVRIPVEKRDLLRTIARIERTEMKAILSDLIDEHVGRHRETLELLSRPEWVEVITRGKAEVADGVEGTSLTGLRIEAPAGSSPPRP